MEHIIACRCISVISFFSSTHSHIEHIMLCVAIFPNLTFTCQLSHNKFGCYNEYYSTILFLLTKLTSNIFMFVGDIIRFW